jgi:hypothetical protein
MGNLRNIDNLGKSDNSSNSGNLGNLGNWIIEAYVIMPSHMSCSMLPMRLLAFPPLIRLSYVSLQKVPTLIVTLELKA